METDAAASLVWGGVETGVASHQGVLVTMKLLAPTPTQVPFAKVRSDTEDSWVSRNRSVHANPVVPVPSVAA